MNTLPKHIGLSAITTEIKCDLCCQSESLIDCLADGEESKLQTTMLHFIRQHEECSKTVKTVLNKVDLYTIGKAGFSPEKFVIDAVRAEIERLKEKD